jgi:hypothetical protein
MRMQIGARELSIKTGKVENQQPVGRSLTPDETDVHPRIFIATGLYRFS